MNPIKISDLHSSLNLLSQKFQSLEGIELRFARLLYLKQFITLCKNAGILHSRELACKFGREYLWNAPFKQKGKIRETFTLIRVLVWARIKTP
jgi:hypothetical protein